MRVKAEIELDLDIKKIAAWFCGLNDEQQAEFIIECAKISSKWDDPTYQWWAVGNHLVKCECSTEEARDLVRNLATPIMHS